MRLDANDETSKHASRQRLPPIRPDAGESRGIDRKYGQNPYDGKMLALGEREAGQNQQGETGRHSDETRLGRLHDAGVKENSPCQPGAQNRTEKDKRHSNGFDWRAERLRNY